MTVQIETLMSQTGKTLQDKNYSVIRKYKTDSTANFNVNLKVSTEFRNAEGYVTVQN